MLLRARLTTLRGTTATRGSNSNGNQDVSSQKVWIHHHGNLPFKTWQTEPIGPSDGKAGMTYKYTKVLIEVDDNGVVTYCVHDDNDNCHGVFTAEFDALLFQEVLDNYIHSELMRGRLPVPSEPKAPQEPPGSPNELPREPNDTESVSERFAREERNMDNCLPKDFKGPLPKQNAPHEGNSFDGHEAPRIRVDGPSAE
jgi:hypothetical protein